MLDKLKLILCLMAPLVIFFLAMTSDVTYSKEENRTLVSRPNLTVSSLLNGEYVRDYDAYLKDHVPFRFTLLSVTTRIEKRFGSKEKKGVIYGKDHQLLEKIVPQNTKSMIQKINKIQTSYNYLNSSLMLIPNHASIDPTLLPYKISSTEEEVAMNRLYYQVTINDINLISTFKNKKERYPLYYSTDATWTSYGAYYAYVEYCSKNDLVAKPLTSYQIHKVGTFYGNLYDQTLDRSIPRDTMYQFDSSQSLSVTYENKKDVSNTFYQPFYLKDRTPLNYYLGSKNGSVVITNPGVKNGKELLIISDGTGKDIVPFLSAHYQRVYVLDLRETDDTISSYLKKHKSVTDLLYLVTMNHINDINWK